MTELTENQNKEGSERLKQLLRLAQNMSSYDKPGLAELCNQALERISELEQLPKIKPLVWVDVFRDDNHAGIKAETTFGKFCITVVEAIGCYVSAAPFYNWPFKECKSEAEAKAWCQAEYERRVRECLE